MCPTTAQQADKDLHITYCAAITTETVRENNCVGLSPLFLTGKTLCSSLYRYEFYFILKLYYVSCCKY